MSAEKERIVLAKQPLALDLGCSPAAFDRTENTVVPFAPCRVRGNALNAPLNFAWPASGKARRRPSIRQDYFLTARFLQESREAACLIFQPWPGSTGHLQKPAGLFSTGCPIPEEIAPRFPTHGETAALRKTRRFSHALARECAALTLAGFERGGGDGQRPALADWGGRAAAKQGKGAGALPGHEPDQRGPCPGKRSLLLHLDRESILETPGVSAGYFPAWLEMASVRK